MAADDASERERTPSSPRARYRDQLRQEIKDVARRHLAELGGAGQLSVNAIARDLGMRGPSLYRYFPSRDALITELLIDAYTDLGDTLRRTVADSRSCGEAPAERIRHYARTYRRWALENPELFDLLYGRPVPGYRAPAETGPMARSIMVLLMDLIQEARQKPEPPAGEEWRTQPVPSADESFQLAVRLAAGCHGLLVLELHGHLADMVPDPSALFETELDEILRRALSDPGHS
ncbi:TetR/AcrR family transcriptional regulator [Sinosporangium siamense]|uniref:TetR family transcriptional regulator n=1 Tax=Sinosporangium siamense TaxID=1367973 RepID=A0A919V9S3_9ACTN|nr:TetR/AcrR family transcriptional regulator [Sinosporangium siamense]GII94637.1 TetR family transcriptional regulator [Sinosporangium siamense]